MDKRKRALLAAVAAVTLFSTVFAVAASLNVASSSLGSGSDSVASCDSDGVATSYDTTYSASLPGYKVTTVHVTGLTTPACDGKSIRVTLVGASDASLAEETATLATPAVDPALDFSSSDVAASDVLKIAVVITG